MYNSHYFAFVGLIFLAQTINAHDLWLQPNPYNAQIGQQVEVQILLGEALIGDPQPNILNWYTDFSYIENTDLKEVEGKIGRIPAGFIVPESKGLIIAGYASVHHRTTLPRDKFRDYLQQEGLLSALDRLSSSSKGEQVEKYTRFATTLIQTGQQTKNIEPLSMGYPFEVIAQDEPNDWKLNQPAKFLIQYQNTPAADITVSAYCVNSPDDKQFRNSTEKGEVIFSLNCSGTWLIKAIKIWQPDSDEYDWESFWATLTFELNNK